MTSRPGQVAVIGGSSCDEQIAAHAEAVGRGLAEAGLVLVCGGLGGVMEAASRGAAEAGGVVIGVIPGDRSEAANPHCTHVVATGIGHARNLAVVASGDVVVAIDGAWGTLSEIAFARNLDRPVVALGSWQVTGAGAMRGGPGITAVETADEAISAVRDAIG